MFLPINTNSEALPELNSYPHGMALSGEHRVICQFKIFMVPVCLDHLFLGGEINNTNAHTHLWGQSIFHQLGFTANFWRVIAVLCLVLSLYPSDAFAPGCVTNNAFVCTCNNHRAANI